jgi:hypothetical protein
MPFTTELTGASTPHSTGSPLPCYQVVNNEGKVIDPNQDPQVGIEREGEERERERSKYVLRHLLDGWERRYFPFLRLVSSFLSL